MKDLITSTGNPKIKFARKLLTDRKERESSGFFVIEGLRLVIEAFEQKAAIENLIIAPDLLKSATAEKYVDGFQHIYPDRVMHVSSEVFQSLSSKDGPQGLAAIVKQNWSSLQQHDRNHPGLVLALDEIADPGNLGTIIRTADSVKASAIILLDKCTDPYDRSALRGSMGAVFSVPLIKSTFDELLEFRNHSHIPIIGTSDRAKSDFHQVEYPADMILLMGSERQGLDDIHFAVCDNVVSIPMLGSSDSLNLAVATGIILYEILFQHQSSTTRSAV